MFWKSVLAVLLIMGCSSTETEEDPKLSVGTYQHEILASDGTALIQFQFKTDGTYHGKAYVSLFDESINCQLSEGTGKWIATASLLKMTERRSRARESCEDAFSEWESTSDKNYEWRSNSEESFEMFMASDEETPAAWLKFTKV